MWRQRSGRDGDRRRFLDASRRFEERSGVGVEAALDEIDGFAFPVDGVGQDVSCLSVERCVSCIALPPSKPWL
jgi:hypothetical protein